MNCEKCEKVFAEINEQQKKDIVTTPYTLAAGYLLEFTKAYFCDPTAVTSCVVLSYLKGVDLKLIDEKRKTIKHLLYKNDPNKSVMETVRLEDIDDSDTYRLYAREVCTNARFHLESLFKRVRAEIMYQASRGEVPLVSPTTAEKRRIRKLIAKCVLLLDQSENIKKAAKKPLESVKRDVSETLKVIHRTMEVVYALRNMSKEAFEDVQYLGNSLSLVADLYMANFTLEDKSEYIKQRVLSDDRGLLLILLFDRVRGVVFNRESEGRCSEFPCSDAQLLLYNNEKILRGTDLNRYLQKKIRFKGKRFDFPTLKIRNVYRYARMRRKDIWEAENWYHVMELGKIRRHVTFKFDCSAREAEKFGNIIFIPRLATNQSGENCVDDQCLRLPNVFEFRRRLIGSRSDSTVGFGTRRKKRRGSWPRGECNVDCSSDDSSEQISGGPARKFGLSEPSCSIQ